MRALTVATLLALSCPFAVSQTTPSAAPLPAFEVATVKPCPPGGQRGVGFHSYPGGRIEIKGVSVKVLIYNAFDVQIYQVSGGPDWLASDCFNVAAESGALSGQHTPESWNPTPEQRLMLQTLLADRFALRYHRGTRQGPVYLLTRGDKPLLLKEPEDKDREPVFAVFVRGEIADGEVRGANVSMPQIARDLGSELGAPVVDQTGLTGQFDLHVLPFDAENRDVSAAISGAMDRLGLKLRRGTGPIETIVIDSVARPTPN